VNIIFVTPGHPGPDRKSLPPALTAPYLAGLSSPYAEKIKIYDLAVEEFDYNVPLPDIALFTTTMAQSDQIFKLASVLKDKGVTIIMGGPHATLAYDFDPRIKRIADSVVLGEGENALPQALKDFAIGDLKPRYAMPVESLAGVPFSRLDLLDHSKYYTVTTLIGTRGCTNNCAYCSIKDIYGHKYLKRPVEEVIDEIKFQTSRIGIGWIDRKLVEFWDDNPACDLDWYHTLLEKMIPLKKWWLSQMCLNVADNEETVKLMKASGCKGIFVGIESVSEKSLQSQNKETINQVEQYLRQAHILLKHGINIIGAFMFGFDEDTEDSLANQTPEIAIQMGLTLMQAHLVTPYPHSEYFKRLDRENRLTTKEAKYYNGYTVVHKPKNLTPSQLQTCFIDARQQFYAWRSILTRMLKHKVRNYPEFLAWNMIFRRPNYEAIPGVNVKDIMINLEKR